MEYGCIRYLLLQSLIVPHLNANRRISQLNQFLLVQVASQHRITKSCHEPEASGESGAELPRNFADGEVALSKAESQKVLEQIGEASGRDVKLRLLWDQLLDSVIEQTNESWEQWIERLEERLVEKAEQWSSEHSALWSRDQLIADYAKQFNNDLSAELNDWIEKQLKQVILQPSLDGLDAEIQKELSAIQAGIEGIDVLKQGQSSNWVFYKDDSAALGDFGFLGNLGLAGLDVAVFVPAIILAGPILLTVGSLVAGGLFGTGVGGVLGIDADIRAKVFENGCEQFVESLSKTFENIDEINYWYDLS
jgi:hypothetical protein